jgi:hypothetical protein
MYFWIQSVMTFWFNVLICVNDQSGCDVTYPSYAAHIWPATRFFSGYVDVIYVSLWIVFTQMDGCLIMVLIHRMQNVGFLLFSCTRKISLLLKAYVGSCYFSNFSQKNSKASEK